MTTAQLADPYGSAPRFPPVAARALRVVGDCEACHKITRLARAALIAAVRLFTCSFVYTFARCHFTVCVVIPRRWEIAALERARYCRSMAKRWRH